MAVFATDYLTAAPLACVAFYAELVAPAIVDPDERLVEALTTAFHVDVEAGKEPHRQRVRAAVYRSASRVLPATVRDRLATDYRFAHPLLEAVLREAARYEEVDSVAELLGDRLAAALDASFESVFAAEGLDIIEADRRDRGSTAYPLGTLATDHVGYLSFDLGQLPTMLRKLIGDAVQQLRADPSSAAAVAIRLHALLRRAPPIDALEQQRFSDDAIVVRLALPESMSLPRSMRAAGYPSIQTPSLTDWRLSPASFAANPPALLGDDVGCESLLPANLSLQEFFFYEVIELKDAQDALPAHLRNVASLGVLHEYKVAWYALGHSLGSLQYSLPLAPGESVKLAVIDWTRRDDAQRKEVGKFDEQLAHQENRDRTISESVRASITEVQQGKSFMAGLASSVGASGTLGAVGIAAGIAGAIGGSSASTSGTRDIAATSIQNVADRITQHSSASRELKSTVVVQASQAEQEVIQTRTVTNYNHSHTLTVLYFEVLRHYRVVTSLVRTRAAVLFKHKADWFEGEPAGVDRSIVVHRQALQTALLDAALAADFDAVARIDARRRAAVILPQAPAEVPPKAAGPDLRFFWLELTTGGIVPEGGEEIRVHATLYPGGVKLADGKRLNPPGSFREKDSKNQFIGQLPADTPSVRWGDIHLINLFIDRDKEGTRVAIKHVRVVGIDTEGKETVLIDRSYEGGHLILDNSADIALPSSRPPAAGPARPQAEIEDDLARGRLVAHLIDNRAHYSRVLFLSAAPADRLNALGELASRVENRPLEVVGHSTAFPCSDKGWSDAVLKLVDLHPETLPHDERLATVPTRGVFAEARLGHCNASEVIDNTRFWDWQTSPIPHPAPEIAPVSAVVPQANNPNPQPSQLPQPLVNIVTPQAAPDPTGLAAAMTVLGTPNIFRDISGQAEVAGLLQKLSDNSISIAQAANMARAIQNRQRASDGSGAGGGSSGPSRPSVVGGQRAKPNLPSAASRDLQDFNDVLKRAVADNVITPEEQRQAFMHALGDATGAFDLQNVDSRFVRGAYTPMELVGLMGEQVAEEMLRSMGHKVLRDYSKHVSGTGFDLVTIAPDGKLWIIDNKAQFKGIGGANALTGPAYDRYVADLRRFLEGHPLRAEAEVALTALDGNHVRKVVSNGFAGEATRFTKGLFEKGLEAFDVRMGKLFSDHVTWTAAYQALALRSAGRVTGRRGIALYGVNLLLIASVIGEGTKYLLSSGVDLRNLAMETVAQIGFDTLLSKLPQGAIAGLVLGLESDNAAVAEERRLDRETDAYMARLPGLAGMSQEDLQQTREAVKQILRDPLKLPPPPEVELRNRPQLWNGFRNPAFNPSPDWT